MVSPRCWRPAFVAGRRPRETATVSAADLPSTARPAPVVDDDLAQCPGAGFRTIQAAVDAADPGGVVKVCPGQYVEHVVVTEPLTLVGVPGVYEDIDCLAETLPAISASDYPIVTAPGPGGGVQTGGEQHRSFRVRDHGGRSGDRRKLLRLPDPP